MNLSSVNGCSLRNLSLGITMSHDDHINNKVGDMIGLGSKASRGAVLSMGLTCFL